MKKKYVFLLWGIIAVPAIALLDTIFFHQRDFISYIAICGFEWIIFFIGVTVGENWEKQREN